MKRAAFSALAIVCASMAFAVFPSTNVDSGPSSIFPFVGYTNPGSGGGVSVVAIDQFHIIASRHAGSSGLVTFAGDGTASGNTTYRVDTSSAVIINGTDAIVYRTLDALPTWTNVYTGPLTWQFDSVADSGGNVNFNPTGNPSMAIRVVGYGTSGHSDGSGYVEDGGTAGTRRWADGRTDSRGNWADLGFGPIDTICTHLTGPNDAAMGGGDSGGGYFIFADGRWQLLAINSHIANDGTMLFGTVGNPHFISGGAYLTPYIGQINAAVPEPASMLAIGTGIAALIARRRRRK